MSIAELTALIKVNKQPAYKVNILLNIVLIKHDHIFLNIF